MNDVPRYITFIHHTCVPDLYMHEQRAEKRIFLICVENFMTTFAKH